MNFVLDKQAKTCEDPPQALPEKRAQGEDREDPQLIHAD